MLCNTIGKKVIILMTELLTRRLRHLKRTAQTAIKQDPYQVDKFVKSPTIADRGKQTFISSRNLY